MSSTGRHRGFRYSHVRSDARPWNDSRFAHARRNVFWVRSWASLYEASMRYQWSISPRRKRSVSSANLAPSPVRAASMNATLGFIGADRPHRSRCGCLHVVSYGRMTVSL